MNLYQTIKSNFKINEVILLSDIYKLQNQVKESTIRKEIDRLIDKKYLQRIDNGIYTLLSFSVTGKVKSVDINKVFEKKFISDYLETYGYYSGLTLLNRLGISNQIPNVKEIVTNKEKSRKRLVKINNFDVILRKPVIKITKENYLYLQFLDILKYLDNYNDVDDKFLKTILVKNYNNKLDLNTLQTYIKYYPSKVAKKFLEYKCYEMFA